MKLFNFLLKNNLQFTVDPNLRPLFFFVKLKKDEKMKKDGKMTNLFVKSGINPPDLGRGL